MSDDLSQDVVLAARAGDPDAFAAIVSRYQRRVHALAYRLTYDAELARDATQDVFLRLYERFDRYDPQRPFTPWFLRLATNLILNIRQKARLRKTLSLDAPLGGDPDAARPEPPDVKGVSPSEGASEAEARAAVRAVIATLPEKYAAVVVLHYLEGLSIREIGARLAVPEGTVKVRLYRARDRLRLALPPPNSA
ncbi:MAG: sigma-70 family RNA polymerase sigma factor [Planctomycetes bacterium]|nr:sigma-70 family RNA polymerase sigma factor [Planctomycetota bacterium]